MNYVDTNNDDVTGGQEGKDRVQQQGEPCVYTDYFESDSSSSAWAEGN